MTEEITTILNKKEIAHKLRRMAFQVYETNVNNKEVIIAGISQNGFKIAKKLKRLVESISPLNVVLCEVKINKKDPIKEITTSLRPEEYRDRSVVLVDDVLSSGTTMIYGVKHFLDVPLQQFKTAVLVDRNHKKYPVKADFKGISLSTSLNENVKVILEKDNDRAILE